MRGLKHKTAIVTGGGGGIGRAICQRLAVEGSHVAVFDINAQAAAATVDLIAANGGSASAHTADITSHEAVKAAVDQLQSERGQIDILVNNAGWDKAMPFLDTDPALWQQIININYIGALNMHHAALPHMVAQNSGKVVNIASDAGRVGSSGEAVYAGCKGALIAFGKSVARELARYGICINAVCPGPTDTALFRDFAGEGESGEKLKQALTRAIPMRRLAQPEDVAGIVAFLASDEASFTTGQVISASGGLSMHG